MRIYLTVGLLVSCVLLGCKKPHDGSSNQTPCEALPECNSVFGPDSYTADTVWMYMGLNPSRPNEILTWKYKAEVLVARNIAIGSNILSFPVTNISSIKWGKDWILYNRWKYISYGEIYRIKPDGSGNQLLAEGYNCFNPVMNPAGTMFLYFEPGHFVIVDMNGNLVQKTSPSLNVGQTPYDWYSDSLLLYSDVDGIYLANVFTGKAETIVTNPNENGESFGCPVYIGQDEFIWFYQKGLMKTNLHTKETKSFIQSCNSVLYYPISYDGTQNRILCGKTHMSNLDNNPCKIFTRTEVLWVDADNAKETIISMDNL